MTPSVFALAVVVPPSQEPITLAEAKQQLRIEPEETRDDERITRAIRSAREWAEAYTRRAFCEQTLRVTLDYFPPFPLGDPYCAQCSLVGATILLLPRPPLRSVLSVAYVDSAGGLETMDPADYAVDADFQPARLLPLYGTPWPSVRLGQGGVKITYKAGYPPGSGSPTDYAENVPASIKDAMLLWLDEWYWACANGKEFQPSQAVLMRLNPFKVWSV